jgi:hypothetical protein
LSENRPHAVHGKSALARDAAAAKVAGLIARFSIKCDAEMATRIASVGEFGVISCGGRASCSR